MHPFQKDARCPQCDGGDVATRYYAAGEVGALGEQRWETWQETRVARLRRTCRCCRYQWNEEPLGSAFPPTTIVLPLMLVEHCLIVLNTYLMTFPTCITSHFPFIVRNQLAAAIGYEPLPIPAYVPKGGDV